MNRRTVCLGLSSLLLATGLALAVSASGAPHAPPVPLMQFGNHLTFDQLGFNLLTTNRLSLTALVNNPLRDESFAHQAPLRGELVVKGKPVQRVPAGALHNALRDPAARAVMKDLVECALGSQQSVSWTPTTHEWRPTPAESDEVSRTRKLTWRGVGAGLCPAWATGAPSARCQELVSACLLSRNNAMGRTEDISLRGDAAIAVSEEEANRFPEREGAFFGNIFDPAALNPAAEKVSLDQARPSVDVIYQKAFACSPPDTRVLRAFGCQGRTWVHWMSSRLCATADWKGGNRHLGCVAQYVGACGARDKELPTTVPQHVCAPEDPQRHTYPSCTAGGRTWKNPVTVYLPGAPRADSMKQCLPKSVHPDELHHRIQVPVVDPMPIVPNVRPLKEQVQQGGVRTVPQAPAVTPADAAKVRKAPQVPAR